MYHAEEHHERHWGSDGQNPSSSCPYTNHKQISVLRSFLFASHSSSLVESACILPGNRTHPITGDTNVTMNLPRLKTLRFSFKKIIKKIKIQPHFKLCWWSCDVDGATERFDLTVIVLLKSMDLLQLYPPADEKWMKLYSWAFCGI